MATHEVELIVTTGEPLTGVWCDRCRLPSAIAMPVYITHPTGTVTDAGTVVYCVDEDRWTVAHREDNAGDDHDLDL